MSCRFFFLLPPPFWTAPYIRPRAPANANCPNHRALQSHAARNIQAGHLLKLDHVVEHYKQKHLENEERKAKKLAEQKE